VAKSHLEQRHKVTEMGIDLSRVRRILGVPRFMFGSAVRDIGGWVRALLTLDATERVRRDMMLCYFAGYLKGARAAEHEARRGFHTPATDKTDS
jgi:hypothetical protein